MSIPYTFAALCKIALLLVLTVFFVACSEDEPISMEEENARDKENPKDEKNGNPKDSIDNGRGSFEFTTFEFRHQLTDSIIPFSYFEPVDAKDTDKKYPLVIALHGAEYFLSTKENFLKGQERTAYMALAWLEKERQQKNPAFVVAPNIHDGMWDRDTESYFGWQKPNSADFVEKLLDSIVDHNKHVDRERVYLVGHSMGGTGSWYLGAKLNSKIAAIVPLSSAFNRSDGSFDFIASNIINDHLRDLPIWAFIHRADANAKQDEDGSRAAFRTMLENGYDVVYTHRKDTVDRNLTRNEIFEQINAGKKHFYTEYSYPCSSVGDCHFAQEFALREDFLMAWLFQQRKQVP